MYARTMAANHGAYLLTVLILMSIVMPVFSNTVHAAVLEPRAGTLWAPYLEWSLDNPDYSGNPFDLVATVTFTHEASGETRTTEMFYTGETTWKFRFTGTKTGAWTFTTASADPELNGHSGSVTIGVNPDAKIKGFLTSQGNKFAQQIDENGGLEAFLFNAYQNDTYQVGPEFWYDNRKIMAGEVKSKAELELDIAISELDTYGFNILYSTVIANHWFNLGTQSWKDHSSVNPDPRTFEGLELAISYIHSKGRHLHIWAWGDESPNRETPRRQTPIGVGEGVIGVEKGINAIPDKRLQRYIAARLGPLPGWSMGYGFDLEEWVFNSQVGEWAKYLHDKSGWRHMLWARGRSHAELDANAYSGFGDYGFNDAKGKLDSDVTRPHLYSERFLYQRRPYWDMSGTRRKAWQYVLAGGMGSWWGRWATVSSNNYPNPEQLRTFQRFWNKRFLLDMNRANTLTNGLALKTSSNSFFVFYKENTSSIQMDLSNMNAPQTAIVVDTKKSYTEITLGNLSVSNQTWTAPYKSDWAIAVGDFGQQGGGTVPLPPTGEQLQF